MRSPVLVVASTDDEVVPYRLSEAVFSAVAGEKRLVTYRGAGQTTQPRPTDRRW